MFCSHWKIIFKFQFSLHRIHNLHDQKLVLSVYQHINLSFLLLLEMFHTLNRIVHGISENRIQVDRMQKLQPFSICHTGNHNIICLTDQTFFC